MHRDLGEHRCEGVYGPGRKEAFLHFQRYPERCLLQGQEDLSVTMVVRSICQETAGLVRNKPEVTIWLLQERWQCRGTQQGQVTGEPSSDMCQTRVHEPDTGKGWGRRSPKKANRESRELACQAPTLVE